MRGSRSSQRKVGIARDTRNARSVTRKPAPRKYVLFSIHFAVINELFHTRISFSFVIFAMLVRSHNLAFFVLIEYISSLASGLSTGAIR